MVKPVLVDGDLTSIVVPIVSGYRTVISTLGITRQKVVIPLLVSSVRGYHSRLSIRIPIHRVRSAHITASITYDNTVRPRVTPNHGSLLTT